MVSQLRSKSRKSTSKPRGAFVRKNFSVDQGIDESQRTKDSETVTSPKRVFSADRLCDTELDASEEEMIRYQAIHMYLIERVQRTVNATKLARFRGFVSP